MPNSRGKKHKSSSKIILNVGGTRHETYLSTLRNIPDTRLYNLYEHHRGLTKAAEFDSSADEYFFDRHPVVFAHILNYYRTGKLHCPNDVCGPLFEEELEFWGIDEEQVETCCWEVYKQHKDKQEKLKYFKLPAFDDIEPTLSKDCLEGDDGFSTWWTRLQPRVWKVLEEPHSSKHAKFAAIISFVLFALYIIKFSLSTLKRFNDIHSSSYLALYLIHVVCLAWFTLDLVLRTIFAPLKAPFFKSVCTWIDLISLVPLYISLNADKKTWVFQLEMLAMLKAVRIFQLFKLSYVMQVLINTLKASLRELCVLLVIMAFQTAVFSSILYFIERNDPGTDFNSIPDTMWWAIITMTTVGYGDVSPKTWMGKIVGCACAIFGVLVIALPVSVVGSNFSIFYTYAKARLNIPQKTRRVALPHAITSMQASRDRQDVGRNPSTNNASFSSDRRNTQRTFNASETSFNFLSSHQGSLANSCNSSLSLQEPQGSPSGTKSLNSLLPDFGGSSHFQTNESQRSISDQLLSTTKEDKPQTQSSVLDVPPTTTKDQNITKNTNVFFSNISLNICPSYPLYVRRGAVTPMSMSLKSNSSNSSYNNVFTGGDLLNVGRPIIFLSGNSLSVQNLRSIQTLIPDKACSCASLGSHGHVHSADDTTMLTPLLCNVNPCIVSTPALNKDSNPTLIRHQSQDIPLYTNGPFISISSPSEENLHTKGLLTVDKCSQTELSFANHDYQTHRNGKAQLNVREGCGEHSTHGHSVETPPTLNLVNNPLTDVVFNNNNPITFSDGAFKRNRNTTL